jgi:succinyl-CoA synthetase alpha subunit
MMKIDEETKMLLEMGEIDQTDIDKARDFVANVKSKQVATLIIDKFIKVGWTKEPTKQFFIDAIEDIFESNNANQ